MYRLKGQWLVSSPVPGIAAPGETECYLRLFSPTVKWVFKTHQEMPKKLVTSVLVLREHVKAKTVEGKSRTRLKVHDVVQLPEPEMKADNHLFRSEGGHLGPAGWLAVPLGTGVPGSCVTRGQAAGDNAELLLSYLSSSSWAGDHSECVQKMYISWWPTG